MERVGIHDVAAAAGVSATTVSHALNGRGKVSPQTRSHVQQVAQRLGYAPNRIASALRSQRSGVIGFVSDEIATTPFAGRIVLGAQDAAAERGQTLMVVNTGGDPGVERGQIEVLRAQQVDALLYATMFHRAVSAPSIGVVPVVLVNAEDRTSAAPSVSPDEHGAAVLATEHLLAAGHRRIAHLTLDERGFGVEGRIAGYLDSMRGAGLPGHVVRVLGPGDARAGREALAIALREDGATTAVFAFNDPMAMGVYQGAQAQGLRVPEDVSVVGIDNLEIIAAQLQPALTTVGLPHEAMGRWAVEEAARRLGGEDGPSRHLLLRGPLVQRASVARPAARSTAE